MNLSKKIRVGEIITSNELSAWQSRIGRRYSKEALYRLKSEVIEVEHHRDEIEISIYP